MTQLIKNEQGNLKKTYDEFENFFSNSYGGQTYLSVMSIFLGFSFLYYIINSPILGGSENFWFAMKGVAFEVLLGITFSSFVFIFSIKYFNKRDTYSKLKRILVLFWYLIISTTLSFVLSVVYFAPFLWFGMGSGI